MKALEEVKPAFGVSEEELASAIDRGIVHYSPYIEHILNEGRSFVNQVRNSATTSLLSVLLHGPPGSGKTALAASISQESQFPFIKLASAENMVGFSEMAKIVIMVVIGGFGTFLGPVIGAAPVQVIMTYLQSYGEWNLAVFALIVMVLMRFSMEGIAAVFTPLWRRLWARNA